jgi:hypothetical protein
MVFSFCESRTGSQVPALKRPIRPKKISRYSTIEAGAALKTNASERGRSRHNRLIYSLMIGFTEAVLCSV